MYNNNMVGNKTFFKGVNMKLLRILSLTLLAFMITACKPDALKVDIYTSDIEAANSGEVIEIPVQVTFQLMGEDKENLLSRGSEIAKKYLHEKTTFSESKAMFGRNLVIDTKLPMGRKELLDQYLQKNPRVAAIVVGKEEVRLTTTGSLNSLSRDIRGLNMMLSVDMPAKHTYFNLVSDSRKPVKVNATAVFISKKPYLHYQKELKRRDSIEIDFKGGEDSVYSGIEPIINLK